MSERGIPYLSFVSDKDDKGMITQFLRLAAGTQLSLVHDAKKISQLYIRNVKSNGWIWSGKDISQNEHFLRPPTASDKEHGPDENALLNVLRSITVPLVNIPVVTAREMALEMRLAGCRNPVAKVGPSTPNHEQRPGMQ